MMIKHSFTVSLLLMYAHIKGMISTIATVTTTAAATTTTTAAAAATTTTTTSDSTENSSPGMLSSSIMSTTQLGSDLNPGTKPLEPISKSTWQRNMSSSPCINMTAETAAGGGTPLRPIFNTHFLFLCSIFTLLYTLRQK